MSVVNVENDWLSLSEYSSEYAVSISTLRRWIKGNKIKFKQLHGKYYLPRQNVSPQSQTSTPVPAKEVFQNPGGANNDITLNTARTLLDELKKAYMESLQSKEDQIIQLKQQNTDLKTLVMFLERENNKYNPKAN